MSLYSYQYGLTVTDVNFCNFLYWYFLTYSYLGILNTYLYVFWHVESKLLLNLQAEQKNFVLLLAWDPEIKWHEPWEKWTLTRYNSIADPVDHNIASKNLKQLTNHAQALLVQHLISFIILVLVTLSGSTLPKLRGIAEPHGGAYPPSWSALTTVIITPLRTDKLTQDRRGCFCAPFWRRLRPKERSMPWAPYTQALSSPGKLPLARPAIH